MTNDGGQKSHEFDAELQQTPKKRVFLFFTAFGLFLTLLGLGLVLAGLFFWLTTGYGYARVTPAYVTAHSRPPDGDPAAASKDAGAVLAKLRPKGVFIVIDRVHNRLRLRDGDKTILEGVISAGAGSVLDDPKTGRQWVFDTPVGRFYVRGRRTNPVWTAPDWDYIESGEPIPRNYSDRVQEGMLGEYALDLGGGPPGYMIHGTLYTRLLGRNVSHGCIRVGRDDLRVVYKSTSVGAAVFMY